MERIMGIRLCLCRICPTYRDCNEVIAFCLGSTGTSACIQKEQGCLCPGCPVQEQEGFSHVYYCTRGTERDQHTAG
jgi:hypothetical protein